MYRTMARVAEHLMPGSRNPDCPLAIAHDYLTQRGGAERVVLALHRIFPEAPIYTTLYDPEATFPEFRDADIRTSALNKIGLLRRNHRLALPLLPLVSTLFRVPARLPMVSSTGWAHGFRATGRMVVYCHSPARWLYLSDQYMGEGAAARAVGLFLRVLKPSLIRWDKWAARRLDQPYIANSTVVRDRIRAAYGVVAPVVHPPQSVDSQEAQTPVPGFDAEDGGFFLVVSRLLPYKNVHRVIEAVRGTHHRLVVVGTGPLEQELRSRAPANVRMLHNLDDAQMRWCYAHCSAVVAVSHEDFGIAPLEGAAFGKPTIALRAGGFLDTVGSGETGAFVDSPTPAGIRRALDQFDPSRFDGEVLRQHAEEFGQARFEEQLRSILRDLGEEV
ncbi:MAG: glycosyltransferase [Kocuria sp.]|nr:glycosyltransferase [Kocuria sp.]